MDKQLHLQTRKRNQVRNEHDTDLLAPGKILEAKKLIAQFPAARRRPTNPTSKYNCHGLTFAARRTQIWEGSEVKKILQDDGYSKVSDIRKVAAGDIIIYINQADQDIEHSGVVVEVVNMEGGLAPVPKILSKWGSGSEFIHNPRDCPYNGLVEYYRLEE